jgi:predicted AAA+ superfamily ATPase
VAGLYSNLDEIQGLRSRVFDLLRYIEKSPDRRKLILILDEIDSRA